MWGRDTPFPSSSVIMSRKAHSPVVTNLQILLRQDTDVHDPGLLGDHLGKKVQAAITTLPTVPALRGVALDALASAFLYLAQTAKEDTALSSALHSACELCISLLSYSPAGWSEPLLQWSVNILAQLSASQDTTSIPKKEIIKFWTSQSLVQHLVKFVEKGVHYKREKGETNIISYFLVASQKEKANLGWLLAHIISQNAMSFPDPLLDNVLFTSLSPSAIMSLSHCLDLLARTHPHVVQETILGIVKKMLRQDKVEEEGMVVGYYHVIIEVLQHSVLVLHLVIASILKIVSASRIMEMMCNVVERNIINEDEKETKMTSDDGDIKDECMQHDSLGPPFLASLSSLLLQLSGEEAVLAINLILDCMKLCSTKSSENHSEDEEEDGEINTSAIAKGQLLDLVKLLLTDVLTVLHKAVSSLLFSSNFSSNNSFSPIEFTVSLEGGLTEWTHQLAHTNKSESLGEYVRELVKCVGMCVSEITAANVIIQLLTTCSPDKLSLILSLYQHYQLRHPRITECIVSQGVTAMLKDRGSIECWCTNLYLVIKKDKSGQLWSSSLQSSFNYLLLLLPLATPTAAVHLLNILESVCVGFASEHRLPECLSATKTLIDYFTHLLSLLAQDILTNKQNETWCREQQLMKCRHILSLLSHSNPLIEVFTCSDILKKITAKEIKVPSSQTSSRHGNLLDYNHQLRGAIQGSLFNTRQAQHSGSLHRKTPSPSLPNNRVTTGQLAITHCSDHILWLISDVIDKSTNQIAATFMDIVAPYSVIPLKLWSDGTNSSQHTLEFHLSIKRKMYESPLLWKLLLLIAEDRKGFLKCSSLIHSLLLVLGSHWKRNRAIHSSSFPVDLVSSVMLIQSIAKAGWIPHPLCYIGELFEYLTCEEISALFSLCHDYLKDNYQTILAGHTAQAPLSESSLLILRAILRKNIKTLGPIYHRFVAQKQ